MANVRINVPRDVRAGDVIEIKTLITHPMETGFRRDARGEAIPRNILTRFECRYDGAVVFETLFQPGIAANPYLSFFLRAETSGTLTFRWIDQHGEITEETRQLEVGA